MATNEQAMICPYCGIPMNHHANKAVYGSGDEPAGAGDSLYEIIEEFHTCPRCGRSGMRAKQ
jgi:ribosomal protein S27AE